MAEIHLAKRPKLFRQTEPALSALWVTIDKLLENEKGNQQLFDELAVDALNEAKGIVTTGVSIENEAETLAFGIDVLEAILDAKRIQLGLAAKT
ncbi:hypothetical protein [Sinorhizobium medicae]|uniref:hypothetical protein n=1 Tax=Sinorhizobium medicae TaxID=110321 RepID=UPI0012F90D1E|nr:hypothetical protein [Sinorhizobium medicae]